MLLAEDLLLLITDDASGRLVVPGMEADIGLGGAALLELALLDRVDIAREGDTGRRGRVIVRDPSQTGDEVLDAALAVVTAQQGRRPSKVIGPLSRNLRHRLYERLAGAGMVRPERRRVLGVFSARRWPAQDAGHETQVRGLVAEALVRQARPDPRIAALIAILHALRCEQKIVDPRPHGLSRRQLSARAEEVTRDNWVADAVRRAIQEMRAANAAAYAG